MADVVSRPPFPTGNSSGSTVSPPSMTNSALSPSYVGNGSVFSARADSIGVAAFAVAAVAVAAGFAVMA